MVSIESVTTVAISSEKTVYQSQHRLVDPMFASAGTVEEQFFKRTTGQLTDTVLATIQLLSDDTATNLCVRVLVKSEIPDVLASFELNWTVFYDGAVVTPVNSTVDILSQRNTAATPLTLNLKVSAGGGIDVVATSTIAMNDLGWQSCVWSSFF